MQLLISVAGPADARAALLGGAAVIDAKDPRHGALGPVTLHRLAAIRAAVGGARPLSAALGDAADEDAIARTVAAAAPLGLAFVKVGFAGVTNEARARRLAVAAQRAARLFAALAGGLSGPEFTRARALRADVVGVRGAACVGGRTGRVSQARVAALRALAGAPPALRVLARRGVFPQRHVELPEIVGRDDEVLHSARERA